MLLLLMLIRLLVMLLLLIKDSLFVGFLKRKISLKMEWLREEFVFRLVDAWTFFDAADSKNSENSSKEVISLSVKSKFF